MFSQKKYFLHPALRSYVRYIWSIDLFGQKDSCLLQIMADRYPRLVIQCLNGNSGLWHTTNGPVHIACLKGLTTKAEIGNMCSGYSHIAVSFYPDGIKNIFGIDANETIDEVIDLSNFCPRELIEKIIEADTHGRRAGLLNAFLLKKLSNSKAGNWRVADFISTVDKNSYQNKLKQYRISERHFERIFLQSVGITPSFYKRVYRFEKALSCLRNKEFKSLVELAYHLDYADQSHFYREFKLFSGQPPKAFIKQQKVMEESGSSILKT